ncbi:MAG: type VI secretion system ATPase TssH, partial [Clostridia bacterium]|nr:type VI secretion system ATPase TssH [Clostridia bacterium]
MSQNTYTQKSMEAIQRAQALALERSNQQLEQVHLLTALLEDDQGLIPQMVKKMGRSPEDMRARSEEALNALPKVRLAGREEGKFYVSSDMDKALNGAAEEMRRMKDEYISVEHLFLSLIANADPTMKKILRDMDITREKFLSALSEVRGAGRVTSDNPEDTYDALKKYGTDLVERARKNQLDPVIGRDGEIRNVIRILSRKT